MDTPESDMSSGSTDSSTADRTPAESSPAHTLLGHHDGQLHPQTPSIAIAVLDNDESSSDISMSADTDDEDDDSLDSHNDQTDPTRNNTAQVLSIPSIQEISKKRKYSGSSSGTPNAQLDREMNNEARKRMKPSADMPPYRTPESRLQQDKSLLPAELWHHIFTFCPPRILGSLLQVNKSFNACLVPSPSTNSVVPLSTSTLQLLQPDAIWRLSRHLHRTGMPSPLKGRSELDMWKLACSSTCQFCGKKKDLSVQPTDQWHPGPGQNGIARIWSFGIRACGPCLQDNSTKEIDLLLSSRVPSVLLPALPFIFLTNELHVLPQATLQSGAPPPTIQISKWWSNSQVEEIRQEFDDAKTLGSATAEEWLKGLDERGRKWKPDAARWERWERSQLCRDITRTLRVDGQGSVEAEAVLKMEPVVNAESSTSSNGTSPITRFPPTNSLQRNFPPFTGPRTQPSHPCLPPHTIPRFDSPIQNGMQYPPPRGIAQLRHERTKEEVAQLKAARRAEIERRCMLLDPPLTASVLAHMPSFQAAMQIIQPLDDGSWEVLKPRLLSQRGEAEQRENDRLAQTRVVQERFDERRSQNPLAGPDSRNDSRNLVDREWDDVQAPLRARISGYADEIIRDGWNGGGKVNYENSPKFAADVLIYIRKRFYAEIAKDEAALRATGQGPDMDPPNGPYLRKLILENMKWSFDTKIKPFTEPYRKELFLCHACDQSKYYGFEGVIQHYAAKHTNALSFGSVVVHWKSEWPEYPPFNPDPNTVATPYYTAAPNVSTPYASNGAVLQQSYGYDGYHRGPPSTTMPASAPVAMHNTSPHQNQMTAPTHGANSNIYQENPGSYYSQPQYGDKYTGPQDGSYPPPQPYPNVSQGYQGQQYSAPPPVNGGYQQPTQQAFSVPYAVPNQGGYQPHKQGPSYPVSAPEIPVSAPGHQNVYAPTENSYQLPYSQSSYAAAQPPPKTEEYKAQLQEVAKIARETWNTINPIKEIPGSVKVYTIIHHLLVKSRAIFQDAPSLAMIIDGLATNKEMRPVRNINGLLCKTCSLGLTGSRANQQKKHFSFPQLLNHFHSVHELGSSRHGGGYSPDWTRDMVELPTITRLENIISGPRKDDQRLRMVIEAIPELNPPPPAELHEDALRYHPSEYRDSHNGQYGDLAPSQDNHDGYYAPGSNGRPLSRTNESYDAGEYDPRNPTELPLEPRTAPRARIQNEYLQGQNYEEPLYRLPQNTAERHDSPYQGRSGNAYIEERSRSAQLQTRPADAYGPVIVRGETPVYRERRVGYREADDRQYYRRRDPAPLVYERDAQIPYRDRQLHNAETHEQNQQVPQPPVGGIDRNRIVEVLAQISQQAQRAQGKLPPREDAVDAGSEDGELRSGPVSHSTTHQNRPAAEASNAAERFLDNLRPSEPTIQPVTRNAPKDRPETPTWDYAPGGYIAREHQPLQEPYYPAREENERGDRLVTRGRVGEDPSTADAFGGRHIHERPYGTHTRSYAPEERYNGSAPEHMVVRDRSPELVDHRYKVNNVVYRDERQNSQGVHRTPSRYARYESVRLENERPRSRSPVYVKVGAQPMYHDERTQQQYSNPIYRSRTPQPSGQEIIYERPPRQEYYRVYADEHTRPRSPQHTEAYELVRVSGSQGEYVIRRPIRCEPEPTYAAHNGDGYPRQPAFEHRAPVPRTEAEYEEEYDPRQPAPVPVAPVHGGWY
ncbi:hypothetical protein BJ875DRAFT_461152 [Amylocarpus encephaloides]|uniref:DUF7892 domain-containing protein n=1 Tax=Amylocarpus encephaloides TaxID=45428 RepID=A0A9P7YJ06_9HELO|nr:hypothetical protein BJ875DRAFT_461152 [Amylocarpus encephaloides]